MLLARTKILAAVYFLLVFVPVLSARSHKPQSSAIPSDPQYVAALAAANHFLHAWQIGDLENGMVLLSDGIRRSQNADTLEKFFSDATNRAFEIKTGHGNHGRYGFPVVLLGARGNHVTRRTSEIVLVDTGKNDWVIDRLP